MGFSIGTKIGIGGPSREQQAAQREAQRQAQIQAQIQAKEQARLAKIKAENLRKQKEREEALRLQTEKTRNETALKQQQQQQQKSSDTTDADQQERERMVRTFQTRRRGRASLRINLGSDYGSSYEGSSGISINL